MLQARLILLIGLMIILPAGNVRADQTLVVRDHLTPKIYFQMPVKKGEPFTIRYIHSVDISPVFEQFRVDAEKGIVLESTWFRMFGAGMGFWEGRGKLVQDGDWLKITEMNDPVGSFLLRVGSKGVDHTIISETRTFNLSDVAAGRRVMVFIEKN